VKEEVITIMRRVVTGEEIAQLRNPDPFAVPAWRSPVYRTPLWIVAIVHAARLLARLVRFVFRHPVPVLAVVVGVLMWRAVGWLGLVALAVSIAAVLVVWRWRFPPSFSRFVGVPARGQWRAWHYRRRWAAVMTIGRLAPVYQGRVLLPVLGKVSATSFTDRVQVRLVSGQSAADFAARADNLAHGFGAMLCRIRSASPGALVLEFVRRDALTAIIPALPLPARVDLRALEVGRREDGQVWLVRVHGTHVLIAGATGAGKASLLWSIVRAMLPAMVAGLVRVWAADPKLMELAYGRAIFDRYGRYAATPEAILAMLEDAVDGMQARAALFAGKHREHTPTPEHPFTVIVVDEAAFLTAYLSDRSLRDRIKAALATLTTQGRAVGYSVVAALQDPRKEVMSIRNLFPDRVAMRLDEPEQVDMVLGDGARARGALADLISTEETTGAGVAYVRLATDPDPVRVRAAWVTDTDIGAMCAEYAPPEKVRPLRADAA
jgi:DNA segregation ATPase FtsK/SpoIIIE, S-DNA-T family